MEDTEISLITKDAVVKRIRKAKAEVEEALQTLKEAKAKLAKKQGKEVISPTTNNNNPTPTNKTNNAKNQKVKTGDDTPLIALSITSTMAVVLGATIIIKSKKKENEKEIL